MNARISVLAAVALCSLNVPAACQRTDLYDCEGCEAVYEHAFDDLSWRTTIAGPDEPGERLILEGAVYQHDGKTPVAGVVVYAYHTNAEGVYAPAADAEGWGRRHGHLRGWVKTGGDGHYRFDTVRPAHYPRRSGPAHIHMIVKEPDHQEYWIDQVVFTDDPQVDEAYRRGRKDQGGSGIVTPVRGDDGVWHATRDIILEVHPR